MTGTTPVDTQPTPITLVEFFTQAREKIDRPEKWTKHTYAKDAHGERVGAESSHAVCFCMSGALNSVHWNLGDRAAPVVREELPWNILKKACSKVFGKWDIVSSNDDADTTHPEVLEAMDLAIMYAVEFEDRGYIGD